MAINISVTVPDDFGPVLDKFRKEHPEINLSGLVFRLLKEHIEAERK